MRKEYKILYSKVDMETDEVVETRCIRFMCDLSTVFEYHEANPEEINGIEHETTCVIKDDGREILLIVGYDRFKKDMAEFEALPKPMLFSPS